LRLPGLDGEAVFAACIFCSDRLQVPRSLRLQQGGSGYAGPVNTG